MSELRRAAVTLDRLQTRATENSSLVLEGYFALTEVQTELYPGCFEVISRGAFASALVSATKDIKALWNHEGRYVLGSRAVGTLTLDEDETGLHGRVVLPDTSYARDLYALVQRGDVNKCSFGFYATEEEPEFYADDTVLWRVKSLELVEVSVVTFPAYDQTSVEARQRATEDFKSRSIKTKKQELKKRLEELKRC